MYITIDRKFVVRWIECIMHVLFEPNCLTTKFGAQEQENHMLPRDQIQFNAKRHIDLMRLSQQVHLLEATLLSLW